MSANEGYIFDIQGFSVHDGPGCRTLIFLKGCTLRCKWCSNPEGQAAHPIPMYNKSKCIFDKTCIFSCPYKAINVVDNKLKIDRIICTECAEHSCEKICSTGAIRVAGYKILLNKLMLKIERDRQYWGSNGGVTLTGGEPLFQSEFAINILKNCYEKYIHTAIETCGNVGWDVYDKATRYLDWMFYDIKVVDKVKHIKFTGSSNEKILSNAKKIAESFNGRLIFRNVVVPGFNDSEEDIRKLMEFIQGLKRDRKEVNILPVHHLSKEKYKMLGIDYFSNSLEVPSFEELKKIQFLYISSGIKCYIKNDTPF